MTLVAPITEPLASRQNDLALAGARETDRGGPIDALANRFGQASLHSATPQPGMPERSVAMVPAFTRAIGRRWADDLPRHGPCSMRLFLHGAFA